jgi:hypothetical protein
MALLLVLSALFALGAAYRIYIGDIAGFIIGLCISAFIALVYFFISYQKKKAEQFKEWLTQNVCSIYSGEAMYNGSKIHLGTKVTQYLFCFSLIVFSVRIPSRYYIKASLSSVLNNIAYTLCTLILGWWGLPWGPIYTLQAVFRNIFGGIKSTVKDLIPEYELEFAKKAYENTHRESNFHTH